MAAQLEALTLQVGDHPLAGLRRRFKCEECGEQGQVAVTVSCTACEDASPHGWFPADKVRS